MLRTDEMDLDLDKNAMILNLINKFMNSYQEYIEGKSVKEIAVECQGGARINFIFHDLKG